MKPEQDPCLKIGELAARCGKTVRALHLYEQMGLLEAAERTQGGFRLFSSDSALRVEWIEAMQALGLSLSEIREFDREFASRQIGPQAAALARKQFKSKLEETRCAIERLQQLETELAAALQYLEACRQCIPPRPSCECPECEVPREDAERPLLMQGFYSKPGRRVRITVSSEPVKGLGIAQKRRRSRQGGK